MPSTDPNKPRGKNPRTGKKKKPEGPQTLIIPQISPEMLESARRAASEGKTRQEIEQAEGQIAQLIAQNNRRSKRLDQLQYRLKPES